MSDTRYVPTDVFVLQPGAGENDPNTKATGKTWGDGQRWVVIRHAADMVGEVKRRCGDTGYLRVLRIGGHGSPGSFRLGNHRYSVANLEDLSSWLEEIHPYVEQSMTLVQLDHCYVGQDESLMKRLAVLMGGVTVMGPLKSQYTNEGAPAYEGKATVCTSRSCLTTVLPNDDPHSLVGLARGWEALSGASSLDPQGPVSKDTH